MSYTARADMPGGEYNIPWFVGAGLMSKPCMCKTLRTFRLCWLRRYDEVVLRALNQYVIRRHVRFSRISMSDQVRTGMAGSQEVAKGSVNV